MAPPSDKFDNTKELPIEEMSKTAFGRWMAEAHNEVILLIRRCMCYYIFF